MVAENLVDLLRATRSLRFEPAGEPLVQLRSHRFGQRLVGDVAQQLVTEAEGTLAGKDRPAGLEKLALEQAAQPFVDVRSLVGRRQLDDRAAVEDLAFDRPPLEDCAVFASEPVEARAEQGLDRGWKRISGPSRLKPFVDQHRHHLFDEERVAFGHRGDPAAEVGESSDAPRRLPISCCAASSSSGASRSLVAL